VTFRSNSAKYCFFGSVKTHFGGKKTPTPTRRVLKKKFDFHFLAFWLAEKKHFFETAGILKRQKKFNDNYLLRIIIRIG